MAIANSINATGTGIQVSDGAGTWTGRTLTAGNSSVVISNGSGTAGNPTISAAGGGLAWSVVTVNATASVNTGIIANKAGTLAMALPAVSAVGDMIAITGINTATGWQITQAAGQQIFFGNTSTTLGATGTITSSAIRDTVYIVCVVANLTWNVVAAIGNPTIA